MCFWVRGQPIQRVTGERKTIWFFKTSNGKHFSELGMNSNYNITGKDQTERRLPNFRMIPKEVR